MADSSQRGGNGARYLTHQEAAERLRMSPRTLHELAKTPRSPTSAAHRHSAPSLPRRRADGVGRRLRARDDRDRRWRPRRQAEGDREGGRVVKPKATAKAAA